jgi:hypothetical protein
MTDQTVTVAGHGIRITLADDGPRRCGDCQLCCKLLPMKDGVTINGRPVAGYHKPAGARCKHQRHGKGCMIYSRRPDCCRMWTCRWLVNNDTHDLPRPDRSHYVIDLIPDAVTARPNDGSPEWQIEVVQIWVDPDYRDAWRDPRLLAYLERRGKEGIVALIRFNESDGITLFPPSMSSDGQFHEVESNNMGERTTPGEQFDLVAKAARGVRFG